MIPKHNKNFYLLLLAYALVEIRATTDISSDLPAKLADVFHHIPEALTLDMDEERDQRVYQQLLAKAEVHGLTELIKGWESNALRRSGDDVRFVGR